MAGYKAEVCYFQPDGEYRRQPGESQSHLKSILLSPAHYKANKTRKFRPSSVMTIGTATHCKVLEGDKTFETNFVKKPDNIKYTTKDGREWRDSQGNKTILVDDALDRQWDCVMGMSETLRKMPWFDPSQPDYRKYNEVSFYWEEMGIPCKARLDRVIVTDDEIHVVDLKTTDSISAGKFQSKALDLGYDFQAGWYSHAAEILYDKPVRYTLVAIERNEPWSVGIFEVHSEMMKEARRKNQKALKILRKCLDAGEWPGVAPTPRVLEYPRWYTPISDTIELELTGGINDFVPLF
jgi:hypothetical protein